MRPQLRPAPGATGWAVPTGHDPASRRLAHAPKIAYRNTKCFAAVKRCAGRRARAARAPAGESASTCRAARPASMPTATLHVIVRAYVPRLLPASRLKKLCIHEPTRQPEVMRAREWAHASAVGPSARSQALNFRAARSRSVRNSASVTNQPAAGPGRSSQNGTDCEGSHPRPPWQGRCAHSEAPASGEALQLQQCAPR